MGRRMCGIAGIISAKGVDQVVLEAMTIAVAHRGPDDAGLWLDAEAGVGLRPRRPSIVRRTPSWHHPTPSAAGRFALTFNGQIYYHSALRARLARNGAKAQ